MNKRQLLLLSAVSALIVSGFGVINAFASDSTSISNKIQELQNRFGITLTDEQKNQIQTKQTEMETQRATELAKWEAMDLATWKQQQIDKINATTQEEFDKIKTRQVDMLKNGKGFGPGLGGERMEKPAE
ncbi:MAG TPA: hypothetical protein PLD14_01775 [Candidatus Pacearchaeota archaeon]|nr:hypothetical protein [Candidatus Pacearchaeota archaeon]HPR79928.1 hypothetical protein [Candidatus Pacearchaeota archaeon]